MSLPARSLALLLSVSLSIGLCTSFAQSTLPETALVLMFPEYDATDNLALDPGNTLETFLPAYFSRLEGNMYSARDARRYALALGLLDGSESMSTPLQAPLVRNFAYRHHLLFTDDPLVRRFGAQPHLLETITPKHFPTREVVLDHLRYYTNKLEDTTLPPRLRETLTFRHMRFEALKKNQPLATAGTHQLSVPFFKQEQSLSCEMASLRSVLAFYGTEVAETMLIDLLGIADPLKLTEGVWGDPQEAFVGNIRGTQAGKTGYGVYWKPVARVAQMFYPSLHWFEGASVTDITTQINAGHPVIIWSVVPAKGGFFSYTWVTPTGTTVTGYNGEHTWVVAGYSGEASNPTHFSIVDPYFGPKTVTRKELETQWAKFGNSGVTWRD